MTQWQVIFIKRSLRTRNGLRGYTLLESQVPLWLSGWAENHMLHGRREAVWVRILSWPFAAYLLYLSHPTFLCVYLHCFTNQKRKQQTNKKPENNNKKVFKLSSYECLILSPQSCQWTQFRSYNSLVHRPKRFVKVHRSDARSQT